VDDVSGVVGQTFAIILNGEPDALITVFEADLHFSGLREAKTDPGMILQGLVEQQAETFGEVGGALSGEKLQNGVEKVRLVVVGHV
jgi:hypothetical protein